MVLANSDGVPRVPPYLGALSKKTNAFRVRGCHPLWPAFPSRSAMHLFFDFSRRLQPPPTRSHDPVTATPASLHRHGLGCSLFAHRYWGNRYCFLFLGLVRCFSSPRSLGQGYVFTLPCLGITPGRFPNSEIPGSKPVRRLPEAYRSLPRLSSPSDA